MFYIEYIGELFKWKLGDPEWTSTGLIEDNPLYYNKSVEMFKLAVSGETVYAGKWDGKLFQSLDEGESWRDVTPTLPLRFTHFKDIVFAGASVYVATDNGVIASQTGENWRGAYGWNRDTRRHRQIGCGWHNGLWCWCCWGLSFEYPDAVGTDFFGSAK